MIALEEGGGSRRLRQICNLAQICSSKCELPGGTIRDCSQGDGGSLHILVESAASRLSFSLMLELHITHITLK